MPVLPDWNRTQQLEALEQLSDSSEPALRASLPRKTIGGSSAGSFLAWDVNILLVLPNNQTANLKQSVHID